MNKYINPFNRKTTLSPSGKYYYRFQKHREVIPKGDFGVPIAFYSINGRLLYHCQNSFALERFPSYSEFPIINYTSFVRWSKDGSCAYICELSDKYAGIVFLDFDKDYCYRIDYNNWFAIEEDLLALTPNGEFDKDTLLKMLTNKYKALQSAMVKDPIPKRSILQKLFSIKRWFP